MNRHLAQRHVPTAAAGAVLVLMFIVGSLRYEHFGSAATVFNLLGDYSYVGIAAIGAMFVILCGGIDLSVGSVVAFTSVLTAWLIGHGWHPLAAGAASVAIGATFGSVMGVLVQVFALPAFMVTLAGMFAMRGAGYLVSPQSLGVDHSFVEWASREAEVSLGAGVTLPMRTMVLIGVAAAGMVVLRWTRFGRSVYAVGGSERSARAMGVPVERTRVGVYVVAGCCSALAGWVLTMAKHAGDPAGGAGLELDVIAAVVIGGTLLSGGVGSVTGTMLGVIILGLIRVMIDFEGNLNSAWTSMATGGLLLAFVGMQRMVMRAGKG